MLGLKKIALVPDMGRQNPSNMEANLGASWPTRPPPKWRPTWAPKYEFLRPKLASILGGVLAALGRHRLFVWSLCWTSFPDRRRRQKTAFSKDLITKSIFSRPLGSGKGVMHLQAEMRVFSYSRTATRMSGLSDSRSRQS